MSDRANPGPTPTVSRVLPDGRLIELLYDPDRRATALAMTGADGTITVQDGIELADGERLVPYAADNNLIATGCVLLPSAVGTFTSQAALVAAVQAFLHRYVDLSPTFEAIAAHYVLLTWVYDAFHELPYLRLRGDYGTGKTRALTAIGALCYKPFFASGASTVSPIFHVLDAFGGTLVLDEADFRFSDATAPLSKILNNGNTAGLPVLRTMTNRHKELNPRAFRVYGPKLVAMRHSFADRALESRFLTEETGQRPLRPEIPIQTPPELHREALDLRNRLLAWRLTQRATIRPAPERQAVGVDPRLNQTALSLLSLMEDPALRARVHEEMGREQRRLSAERASSPEGLLVQALAELFADPARGRVTVSAVTEAFNRLGAESRTPPASPRQVGWRLRERLKLSTTKSNGVFVVPPGERAKVEALAARYGIAVERQAA
ncbi:hypothetical protein [Brevundimonas sp.]|uniref:hypothetical protein n=2 Tax=Brevundimonas sp. TaxID=1871086 RepID=UPI0027EEF947|nr:hypothetical protein [Brevundimonas sp.]MDQ7812759.1 hypothetical protein [Brevundimonas sp.]